MHRAYGNPNLLGDGGIPAPDERAVADRIRRTLPDFEAEKDEWAGRTVLLVGAGKSAQTAARDLAALAEREPRARVVWAVRSPAPDCGVVADDPLPQRQQLVDVAERLAGGETPAIAATRGWRSSRSLIGMAGWRSCCAAWRGRTRSSSTECSR